METKFIDLHLHPAIKPLGKSFNRKPGVNNPNASRPDSIWHYDPPTVLDKITNMATTLTKFRQADFTTLAKGGAQVVFASLCGLEKGFVMSKLGTGLPADLVNDLVVGMGKKRINHVQALTNYFADLEMEYNYYHQLDGHIVQVDGRPRRYKMVSNFQEIGQNDDDPVHTIYVILTIEGGHVFNCGLQMMGLKASEKEVLANVDRVKQWDKRLFFMGLTHHFDNELVGHAESLSGAVSKICDQKSGQDDGFTPLGWKVLRRLLDTANGRRVLIDLKHMSLKARSQYYQFLETEHAGETIPLIVSHGAVTGLKSAAAPVEEQFTHSGKFQVKDINFYNDEIVRLGRSGGLFGIQFDERRLGDKQEVKASGHNLSRRQMLFKKSRLIWNQVQHIAEVLDHDGQFAWGTACIGSDNDGMVNPLNGFWTAEEFPLLDSYLEKHAYNFVNSPEAKKLKPHNRLTADEIVERFMHGNAWEFLQKHF